MSFLRTHDRFIADRMRKALAQGQSVESIARELGVSEARVRGMQEAMRQRREQREGQR